LKPKVPLSPEVTDSKPGNYPELCVDIISNVGLKKFFMPLFGTKLLIHTLVFDSSFHGKSKNVMK